MKLFAFEKFYQNSYRVVIFGIKITLNSSFSERKNKYFNILKAQLAKFLARICVIKNKSQKKYPHIVTFGKNCELAIEITKAQNKVESTLFSWSAYENKDVFLNAIKNPNIIFSQDASHLETINMFKCNATSIAFHGNKMPSELYDNDGTINKEKYEIEKQSTFDKIKYLADKNEKIYCSSEHKLYALSVDYKDEQDIHFIKNLYNYLSTKNSNFDMLLIIENDKFCQELEKLQNEYKNLFIRKVCFFTKNEPIVLPFRYHYDWMKIFTEFVSTAKNAKKKKLKCD